MARDNESEDVDIPHVRKDPRPDFTAPLPAKKLPKYLQDTIDSEEKYWEVCGIDDLLLRRLS